MKQGRVLDLGLVSPPRSISAFHAVARCLKAGDGPTLILVQPRDPFVCVGYHQVLEKETDQEACQRLGIPVLRREVGGGTVLLDENQVFFHLVLPEADAPRRILDRYEVYSRPAIETHRHFGVNASFRPINDIHVTGRKIGGTGGATIGDAAVFVGSMMMDFNHDLMAQVLRVPHEKMRDKVHQTLWEYITSMKRELGQAPPVEEIKAELTRQFEAVLGAQLAPGTFSAAEQVTLPEVEARFTSPDWLYLMDRPDEGVRNVKIMEGVYVREAAYKASGGLIRATVRLNQDVIEDVVISGDFYCYPATGLEGLRHALVGARLDEAEARAAAFFASGSAEMPGVTAADIAQAVAPAAS